jgi:hypothetical protein
MGEAGMTILPCPPKDWKRPTITLAMKLVALFRRYGKHDFDHDPQLSARPFNTETNDTIPPANDIAYINALTSGRGGEHDVKTNGPCGEKRITTAGSDSHARAKTRHLTKPRTKTKWLWPRGRKIQSRPFSA